MDLSRCPLFSFRLRDGRALSYRQAGSCGQQPPPQSATVSPQTRCQGVKHTVIYHHGWPSSSAEVLAWHEATCKQGISVIAPDRPGIGCSTFNVAGSFASYADDVSQLLRHLGLHRVIHIGTSGGGPYACACAAHHPASTAALGLMASMTDCAGPGSSQLLRGMDWSNRLGYSCIAHTPLLTQMGLAMAAPVAAYVARLLTDSMANRASGAACGNPHQCGCSCTRCRHSQDSSDNMQHRCQSAQLAAAAALRPMGPMSSAMHWAAANLGRAAAQAVVLGLPSPDRKLLWHQPELVGQVLGPAVAGAFQQGSRGVFHDMRLTTLPWGFSLGCISAPAVVYQGDADVNVTVSMAAWLEQHIPCAQLRVLQGEAHLSLTVHNAAEMLHQLTQLAC